MEWYRAAVALGGGRPDDGQRTSHADTHPAPTNHHTDRYMNHYTNRYTNRWA